MSVLDLPFCKTGPDGRLIKANDSFADLIGFSRAALHHRSMWELSDVAMLSWAPALYERAKEAAAWMGDLSVRFDYRLKRSDDGIVPVTVYVRVDREGNAWALVVPDGTPQPSYFGVLLATAPMAKQLAPLTLREREVVLLVTDGQANKDIARQLHISTETVKRHLSSVFRKLKVSSRSALVAAIRR